MFRRTLLCFKCESNSCLLFFHLFTVYSVSQFLLVLRPLCFFDISTCLIDLSFFLYPSKHFTFFMVACFSSDTYKYIQESNFVYFFNECAEYKKHVQLLTLWWLADEYWGLSQDHGAIRFVSARFTFEKKIADL